MQALQAEIAWLREQMREQLRSKDEQLREQLRAKDEQLRQMTQQMTQLLQAKDEQISGFMASMSPISQLSSATQHFPASPVPPYSPQPLPPQPLPSPAIASPTASTAVAATTEQRRHTRTAHLRAAEEASRQQTTASRDHGADRVLNESVPNQDQAPAVALSELQAGGRATQALLTAVLDHGLEVLESIPRVPRKEKRAVRLLCEEVEKMLEGLDTHQATQLVELCEEAELAELHRALGVVSSMGIGVAGMDCVEAVQKVLSVLSQCSDPTIGATRAIDNANAAVRMRGLQILRGLPRVVLAQPVAAELAAATISVEIGVDISRDCAERQAAVMSAFALGFRNGVATTEALGKFWCEGTTVVTAQIYANELSGRDGVALWTAMECPFLILHEFSLKGETAALRGAAEKQLMTGLGKMSRLDCTQARYAELLPMLLELFEHDDIAVASSAAAHLTNPIISSAAACVPVLVASREYPDAILALLRRIDGTQQLRRPAAWWKARSEAVHLDSVCLAGAYGSIVHWSGVLPTLPPNSAACKELLAESIHVCMMNKEAELSAKTHSRFHMTLMGVLRVVVLAAREQSRHKSLLASGVVDALLWTTAHDSVFLGVSLAESSASATVALIGRNEGGLTLTHETVDTVLNVVHMYWDTTSTHYRVKMAAKAPVTKLIGRIQPVVDMVIADANKPFVLEHPTAIDDLVKGLLVDHSSPRRTQDGAGQLQEICALV
eukprot:COSAG01_NODE_8694_length_2694_cov_71.102890_3_plen_725_part_01